MSAASGSEAASSAAGHGATVRPYGATVRPYYEHLGLEVLEARNGSATVRLPDRRELGNSRGDVHGGAIASLLDVALSSAVRSSVPDRGGATTISMTITYLQPGRGVLIGHGRVVRAGRTIVAVEGDVRDEQDSLVAHGVGTFRVLPRRPADGGS